MVVVSQISGNTGVKVNKLLDREEPALLDAETLREVRDFSTETGLSVENLVADNAVIKKLLAYNVENFIDEPETMVDEELADKVENFMSDLSQIGGGIETFLTFEGYDECVAGGGGVCNQVQATHDNNGLE